VATIGTDWDWENATAVCVKKLLLITKRVLRIYAVSWSLCVYKKPFVCLCVCVCVCACAYEWLRIGCVSVTTEGYIAVATRADVTAGSSNVGSAACQRVAVMQSLTGRLVSRCDVKPASKDEQVPWPYGIATTETGHVAVSDAANHCVLVFDAECRLVRRFGRRGSRNRQFKSPRHLATTPNDNILVSDYGNHCVKARALTTDLFLFAVSKMCHVKENSDTSAVCIISAPVNALSFYKATAFETA